MSKLGCQLPHKISDSRSQNRNINLIFDRILFLLFSHNLYMFVNKKKHKYDINLSEIKRITADQIPDSAFNSAVNYLFFADSST